MNTQHLFLNKHNINVNPPNNKDKKGVVFYCVGGLLIWFLSLVPLHFEGHPRALGGFCGGETMAEKQILADINLNNNDILAVSNIYDADGDEMMARIQNLIDVEGGV